MKRIKSSSTEETLGIGAKLGAALPSSTIITLTGDLGAGKTTLIKGIALGFAKVPTREVCSPTFTYLNIYPSTPPIFHFDLYRLRSSHDFFGMGFDEHFEEEGLCLIEWPEIINDLLPQKAIHIEIIYTSEKGREIILKTPKKIEILWDY